MLIIPSIDIQAGRVVRLRRGQFTEETVYSDDPVACAKRWETAGAKFIHCVDLDGAVHGELRNLGWFQKIVRAIDIPIDLGGGIRTEDDAKRVLDLGVARVILGTKACEDPALVERLIAKHGAQLAIALDARQDIVVTDGWTKPSVKNLLDMAKGLNQMGAAFVIYTNVMRDGTLEGPDLSGAKRLLEILTSSKLILSGGVGSLDHVRRVAELGHPQLYGLYVGKALYEKKFTLAEAQSAALGSALDSAAI